MKTYYFPVWIQRRNLAFAIFWSLYMVVLIVRLLNEQWPKSEINLSLFLLFALVSCVLSVALAHLFVLWFCTSFEIDENGITQHVPCMAPVRVAWDEISELRLRMYGLQIKTKNHRKALRVSIHLENFKELWKTIEEKSGQRAK